MSSLKFLLLLEEFEIIPGNAPPIEALSKILLLSISVLPLIDRGKLNKDPIDLETCLFWGSVSVVSVEVSIVVLATRWITSKLDIL